MDADPAAGVRVGAGSGSGRAAAPASVTASAGTVTDARTPVMSRPPWSTTSNPCRAASRPTTNSPMRRDVVRSTEPASPIRPFASAISASFMPMPSSRTSTDNVPSSSIRLATVTRVSGAEKAVALSSNSATSRMRSPAA